ncbi:MAG: peptidylprolyl isomerase [Ignavibacteriaceae bacterium]
MGCSKEKPKVDYVAKVNDSYLTEDELSSIMNSPKGKNFYREEVIRNWINTELLYQEARSEGITKDENFTKIIEDSKKNLAVAKLLQKHYDDIESSVDTKEIETFFEEHKDEFKTTDNYYIINFISFTNEDKAVQFRSSALENDWDKSLKDFKSDPSINYENINWYLSEYEIEPISLLRIIKELNPNEISIVFADEQNKYIIVQLINKIDKGVIPPFNLISENVAKRFLAEKKAKGISEYVKELYSKNEIDVKN